MDTDIARAIDEAAPYSMAGRPSLAFTVECALEAIAADRVGDLVECGVWKGGASFAMLLAQRYRYGKVIKPVWMFDSFQGLPPVQPRDGPAAAAYQQNTNAPSYFDNCTAPLDGLIEAVQRFEFTPEEAIIVPGWFNETIPTERAELESRGVAFLRVDCDWYEPALYVLNELATLLADGGRVLLDDYYTWDGSARATHDFLSKNDFCWRICTMHGMGGAVCAWMARCA